MEGIGGQLRAIVNGRRLAALTPLQPGQMPTLQPATTPVQTLTPLQPGQLPTITDPNTTGYANNAYANALRKYADDKSAALNAARAAMEEAERIAQNSRARNENIKAAAIGAGVIVLAIKFLL